MKVLIERHGTRDYVYLYTSKRVKGRQSPEVVKRYAGVLDPETGMVMPKRVSRDELLSEVHDGEFDCADRGGVLLAMRAAEELNIRGILERGFGESTGVTYALVLAMAADPWGSCDGPALLSRFCLDDVLGGRRVTESLVSQTMTRFQEGMRDGLPSAIRAERKYVFVVSGSTRRMKRENAGLTNRRVPRFIDGDTLFMVTDSKGMPLVIRSTHSHSGPMDDIRTAMDNAERSGGESVLVLREAPSVDVLASLAVRGTRFISSGDWLLDVRGTFSELIGPADAWLTMTWRGREYKVVETDIGATLRPDGWMVSLPGENEEPTVRMRAMVWYDPKAYEEAMRALTTRTRTRSEDLSSMRFEDARDVLSDGSTESRFMTVAEGPDGGTVVTVRRKERRDMAFMSSLHLFVTNCGPWDECMDCIDLQSRLLSNSEPILRIMMGPESRFRSANILLAFLAMRVRLRLEKMLAQTDMGGLTVDGAFRIASGYSVVRVNGRHRRSRIPREAQRLFEELGIDAEGDLRSERRLLDRSTGPYGAPSPSFKFRSTMTAADGTH